MASRQSQAARYWVWCPGRSQAAEDARWFSATSPAGAAKAWANCEDAQSSKFRIANGDKLIVCVRLCAGGPVQQFRVWCHQTREYFADVA